MRSLDGLKDSMDMSLSKLREMVMGRGDGQMVMDKPGVLQSMGSQKVRHDWVTEQQQQTFTFKFWQMYQSEARY